MRRQILVLVVATAVGCTARPVPYQAKAATEGDVEVCEEGECAEGEVCFEGTCVGTGLVRVSLAWEIVTDLDLHVITPDGIEVYYGNPEAAGLTLDVDDCVGGFCADPDATHVENIFFSSGADRGEYTVFVVNFDGLRASDYRVEVVTLEGDELATWSGSLPAQEGATSPAFAFTW